jgi:predicted transcriptional regulator
MLGMAKQKRPQRQRVGKALNVWISDALRDALDTLAERTRPKAPLTAHVETALEEYLAKHGLWPPEADDQ